MAESEKIKTFCVALTAWEEGSEDNIADYTYFGMLPLESFHAALKSNIDVEMTREKNVPNYPNQEFCEILGVVPTFISYAQDAGPENIAGSYAICFKDLSSRKLVPYLVDSSGNFTRNSNVKVHPVHCKNGDFNIINLKTDKKNFDLNSYDFIVSRPNKQKPYVHIRVAFFVEDCRISERTGELQLDSNKGFELFDKARIKDGKVLDNFLAEKRQRLYY